MESISPEPGKRFLAHIETGKGTMAVELMPDRAPKTVSSFVQLARQGFYDGLTFHRVVRGFMIQGGCPRGDGTGGPGYTLPAEFNDLPHEKGVISMARSQDPDSAGSQFFIVHAGAAAHLDGAYTAFGKLVEGLDVLDALAATPVEWNGSERSRPAEKLVIEKVTVTEEELPAPAEEEEQEQEQEEGGGD